MAGIKGVCKAHGFVISHQNSYQLSELTQAAVLPPTHREERLREREGRKVAIMSV